MVKLSDFVINFLEKKGIKTMFFIAGGGCMHLTDSLGQSNINQVNLLHEQSVAIAAESYAFSGDTVGAALVTTGPGGTNTVTGVLSAFVDSIPCIFLSGQVKTSDLKDRFGVRSHGSQEADIVEIVRSITKYAVLIKDKEEIRYHLEKCWYEATHGRKGPVWIDIPLDIQGAMIDENSLKGFEPAEEEKADFAEEAALMLNMIENAEKPVMIIGNGVRANAEKLIALAEKMSIPVIPSWKAADIMPTSHPMYAGKCGTLGERAGNFTMQTADLLISVGCKLDFSVTGFDRSCWCRRGKKVVVDIDKAEIDKLGTDIQLAVVGDGNVFIDNLEKQIEQNSNKESFFANQAEKNRKWLDKIKNWKKKYPIEKPANALGKFENGKISTYDLIEILSEEMPENSVVVPASAGTVAEICYQALKIKKGQKIRSNHGLGSMGYELPSAVGAYFATGKDVIVVAGDGGMQLNIQELAIIAGRNLPIKIFVVDNQGYSSIRNMQRNHFQGRYVGSSEETGLNLPNMERLGSAYGLKTFGVKEPDKLRETVKLTLETEGAVLCNVCVDEYCIVSPRSTSKVMPDGSIVSAPLEDLFPFLPAEVLKNELE